MSFYSSWRAIKDYVIIILVKLKFIEKNRFFRSPFRNALENPLFRHCEFHTNIHHYHIVQYATETPERYEKMLQELGNILRTSGVNRNTVEKITEEIREARTAHATFNSPQRAHYEMILKKNPMILKKLVQMFYYDYILFGFPIPNI
jgi:hypothetical protein